MQMHDTLEQHPGVELTRIRRINEQASLEER